MKVRQEEIADIAQIHETIRLAFLNAEHTDHNEQNIVDRLRETGELSLSFVCEIDNKIVGHIALSPVTIKKASANWYGLGPVAVLPDWQRQGIGKALIKVALAELANMDAGGCVVLGYPDYYQKFGFKVHTGLVFPDLPAEYFMALHLSGPLPMGEVTYCPAFYQ